MMGPWRSTGAATCIPTNHSTTSDGILPEAHQALLQVFDGINLIAIGVLQVFTDGTLQLEITARVTSAVDPRSTHRLV